MEAIYTQIQMAEDNLRTLREQLLAAEKAYTLHGTAVSHPTSIANAVLPFVLAASASAKAASFSSKSRVY
jgi:hypothetical protein